MRLMTFGGAATATVAALLLSLPTASAAGLSDNQRQHIQDYIDCSILLLTDIPAFNDTVPCGGSPSRSTSSLHEGKSPTPCTYRDGFSVLVVDNCGYYPPPQ